MKKRIIFIILAMSILFAMAVPASADNAILDEECVPFAINVDEEIERALNGETDLEVDDIITPSAWLEDEYGNVENVEVFVTTRELTMTTYAAGAAYDGEKIYATTVVASTDEKSESNSNVRDYVTATVTLVWVDKVGWKNEIVSASGSWSIDKNPNTGKKATLDKKTVLINGKYMWGGQNDPRHYSIPDDQYSFQFTGDDLPLNGSTGYTVSSQARINGDDNRLLTVEVSN